MLVIASTSPLTPQDVIVECSEAGMEWPAAFLGSMRDMISLGDEIKWRLNSTIVFFLAKRQTFIWTLHEVMFNNIVLSYFDFLEILLQKESCQSLKQIHHFPLNQHGFFCENSRNLPALEPPISFSGIPFASQSSKSQASLHDSTSLCKAMQQRYQCPKSSPSAPPEMITWQCSFAGKDSRGRKEILVG